MNKIFKREITEKKLMTNYLSVNYSGKMNLKNHLIRVIVIQTLKERKIDSALSLRIDKNYNI